VVGAEIDRGDRADLALAEGVDGRRDLAILARIAGRINISGRLSRCQLDFLLEATGDRCTGGRSQFYGPFRRLAFELHPQEGFEQAGASLAEKEQAAALFDVIGQGSPEFFGQSMQVGNDYGWEFPQARLELVFRQDIDGVMEIKW
jgi:hypothetical protein